MVNAASLLERTDAGETYHALRTTQRRINSELVKRISKATLVASARRLGLWRRGKLVAQSEDDLHVLFDFCIHDCHAGGKNAAARYRAQLAGEAAPDEALILEAMSVGAPVSLYVIQDRLAGKGAQLQDLLTGEEVLVYDRGLGDTAERGFCLAARLLSFPSLDIRMTSGAAVGVDDDLAYTLAEDIHAEIGGGAREARDGVRRLGPAERGHIAVRILRELLSAPV